MNRRTMLRVCVGLGILSALLLTTQLHAREQHVRWIDPYTIQITFTPNKDMFMVCYTRRHPIYLPQGQSVGCLTAPNSGAISFELGKNPDTVYNPQVGDEYRITINYRDGSVEYYGNWMPIENSRPLPVRSRMPIIFKNSRA